MPAKNLLHGEDSREAVLEGVRKLTRMVVATMGPKGRTILVERGDRAPMVTKDGVSVAKEIFLKDPFENMGAQMVKEAATKTNDAAGDGTTTATLLAYSIMSEGMKEVQSGRNAISIKRGIDKTVEKVCEFLDAMSKPIENKSEYQAIANISAQDERVGEAIAKVIEKTGPDGVVTVEKGQGMGIDIEYVDGMEFDNGFQSPYFVTDAAKQHVEILNTPVLVTDERITNISQLLPILNALGSNAQKTLVIISEEVTGEAMATLIVNKMKGNFFACPVRAPAFGSFRRDMLLDIAAVTGATYISRETGKTLEKATVDDLGSARRVVMTKSQTTIVEGGGDSEDVKKRVEEIRDQIKASNKDSTTERLQERLAKLAGGIGIIQVGAATEVEQKELQHRVEDALSATKAAMEEGVVPGGGIAYVRAMENVSKAEQDYLLDDDERTGASIVLESLSSCARAIIENAGVEQPQEVIDKVANNKKGAYGYNAATGEYGDMLEMKIIDPKKVSRSALQNASSVAGTFLTLEGAIADEPEKEKELT